MAKGSPSQRYGTSNGRFWANVVLIALAHVALIAGLIRWSVAAKASSNPESIVWLGSQGDLSADESRKQESPSSKQPAPDTESRESEQDETADEEPVLTSAKSEIELPSATPEPTATSTPRPKPSATPAPRSKPTPKPIPKPTARKTLVAKASVKPSPKAVKDRRPPERRGNVATAKTATPSRGTENTGSTDKTADVSGGSSASEFGWYGNMLHDRFYSAWIQPTTNVPSGTKISTLVNVRIEKDGRVSKFEIAKPSENPTVNESVAAVAKQISHVDSPPTGLIKGDHYDVKINFELNTEQGGPK